MFSLKRQQGASFEHQARLFLESKGLKFIAANQNFKCGELDLIMSDKGTIVFVEVRQRSNNAFGSAIESVDWQKKQKWLNAANLWLAKRNLSLEDADCRFDLIAFGKPPVIFNGFLIFSINLFRLCYKKLKIFIAKVFRFKSLRRAYYQKILPLPHKW